MSAVHVPSTFLSEPRGSVWNIKKWCSQHIVVVYRTGSMFTLTGQCSSDPAQRQNQSCIVLWHGWIWWVEKAADLAQMKCMLLIGHFEIGIYTYNYTVLCLLHPVHHQIIHTHIHQTNRPILKRVISKNIWTSDMSIVFVWDFNMFVKSRSEIRLFYVWT